MIPPENIFIKNSTEEELIYIEGPQALNILTVYARHYALRFQINYDETGGDNWAIFLNGQGEGENFFSGKRNRFLRDAVAWTLSNAEIGYKDFVESPCYVDIMKIKEWVKEFDASFK